MLWREVVISLLEDRVIIHDSGHSASVLEVEDGSMDKVIIGGRTHEGENV